jgi:hypothetical protein
MTRRRLPHRRFLNSLPVGKRGFSFRCASPFYSRVFSLLKYQPYGFETALQHTFENACLSMFR